MKSYAFVLISIIALMMFSGCAKSQIKIAENQLENFSENITEEQIKLIYENTKNFPNNTQLSVAMVENGKTHFFGIQRTNDSIFSIDNHKNVFEIGSVSKVFTSTLLANLTVLGEVALDDPITKYLDNEITINEKIILTELANHTSGLPRLPLNLKLLTMDPENPYKNYGEKELKEYLQDHLKLNQPQGEKSEYSNLGAGLLGYVLSQQADMSYEELLQKYIFSKYNMANSTTNREKIMNQLIGGLNIEGKPTSNWDLNVLMGAGGILSTTEDLSKFAIAQFDDTNEALALTRESTFTINENMDVALGWHILKNKSTNNWHWHNGGTGGYTSSMTVDVDNKNAIIILSNVSAFHKKMGNIDQLCFALMKTL